MAGKGAMLQLDEAGTVPKPTDEDVEVGSRGRHESPFGAPGTASVVPATAEQLDVGVAASAVSELDLLVAKINKQELVCDVANAVCQQVEAHTAEVVGEVWNQGKLAMQKMQREHSASVESMQCELKRCTDSFLQLQRENAALRMRLEAMARHFQMLNWNSQWVSPCYQNPSSFTFAPDQYKHAEIQQPQPCPQYKSKRNRHLNVSHSDPGPRLRSSLLPPTPEEGAGDIEDDSVCSVTQWVSPQETPLHSIEECVESQALPPSVASITAAVLFDAEKMLQDLPALDPEELLQDVPAPSTPLRAESPVHPSDLEEATGASQAIAGSAEKKRIVTTPSTAASAAATSPASKSPISPIGLTLRRAQGQPLGLKVRELGDHSGLFVESVQPGSVADSWNQQCAGESREIKPGDRLVSVNGETVPMEMRKECLQKLLLRLELVRETDL